MGNQCSTCCGGPAPSEGKADPKDCREDCRSCCASFGSWCDRVFCCRPAADGKPHLPTKPDPDERPKPGPQDDITDTTPLLPKEYLSVKEWDWCRDETGPAHNTSLYHCMTNTDEKSAPGPAVCRRGQPLSLRLTTNRRYDPARDKIGLVFTVTDCKNPNFGNGTQEGVTLDGEYPGGWGAKVSEVQDKVLYLKVTPPVTCIIGAWTVEADIATDGSTHNFTCPHTLYVLFNPWCEDDPTYLSSEKERKEYILQDTGLIWRGTHNRMRPCVWQFAQFDAKVLECVLMMLTEVCKMSASHRADPIKVARAISAGINSPDDKGVLVGNWTGEYEGGTSPTKWNGSINIFTKFYETKEPVKYGQCWVFSGVVATACRTLGLPCRPVTNFSSAHDTHNSLTIDYFFDDEGEVIERLNSDSIWNFHVWNEVWMTRPDLGTEYDGWQIIDATPQEESDGQYRCGPASLNAVKNGNIHLPYDVPFVYSEVNADKLYWKYRGPRQPMKLLGRKTQGVGLNVSTKAVGRFSREDITHLYKHQEETEEERNVMKDALRRCENVFARYYLNEEIEDVEFDLQLLDDIIIGQTFQIMVAVTNKSSLDHDVSVVLRADTTLYTGEVKSMVKKEHFDKKIKANSTEKITIDCSFEEYYSKLADQCALTIACLGKVKDSEFEYFAQDDFRMRKPDIEITPSGEFKPGLPTVCKLSFKNPLPLTLNKGYFYVVATKCKYQFIRLKDPVPPGGEVKCEVTLAPCAPGDFNITTSFTSKELEDVDGYLSVEVKGFTSSGEEEKKEEGGTPSPAADEEGTKPESVEMDDDKPTDAKSEAGDVELNEDPKREAAAGGSHPLERLR